jgi:hypothetical protein
VLRPFSYLSLNLDIEEVPPFPLSITFPLMVVEEDEDEQEYSASEEISSSDEDASEEVEES